MTTPHLNHTTLLLNWMERSVVWPHHTSFPLIQKKCGVVLVWCRHELRKKCGVVKTSVVWIGRRLSLLGHHTVEDSAVSQFVVWRLSTCWSAGVRPCNHRQPTAINLALVISPTRDTTTYPPCRGVAVADQCIIHINCASCRRHSPHSDIHVVIDQASHVLLVGRHRWLSLLTDDVCECNWNFSTIQPT